MTVFVGTSSLIVTRQAQLDLALIGKSTRQVWADYLDEEPWRAMSFIHWRNLLVAGYQMQHGIPPLPGFAPALTQDGLVIGPAAWRYDPKTRLLTLRCYGMEQTINLAMMPSYQVTKAITTWLELSF